LTRDKPWATVGSSNLDPLSLLLAREANVVVEDAGFAHRPAPTPGAGDAQRRAAVLEPAGRSPTALAAALPGPRWLSV
jgi:phosphatidylserine/phosphatidylglycerophosphate/cardiolipin synthase-like enzyme